MRLSEIGNKDIIDLTKGCNHGPLWDCELLFEKRSGRIAAILIPAGTFKIAHSMLPPNESRGTIL